MYDAELQGEGTAPGTPPPLPGWLAVPGGGRGDGGRAGRALAPAGPGLALPPLHYPLSDPATSALD